MEEKLAWFQWKIDLEKDLVGNSPKETWKGFTQGPLYHGHNEEN
jgi:hypothetical protein